MNLFLRWIFEPKSKKWNDRAHIVTIWTWITYTYHCYELHLYRCENIRWWGTFCWLATPTLRVGGEIDERLPRRTTRYFSNNESRSLLNYSSMFITCVFSFFCQFTWRRVAAISASQTSVQNHFEQRMIFRKLLFINKKKQRTKWGTYSDTLAKSS